MKKHVVVLASLTVLSVFSLCQAELRYSIIDLGSLGGDTSIASGINDSGQIAGHSYITGNSALHAFLYDGTSITDLGTLGGIVSRAYVVNDSGQIVGTSRFEESDISHAFLYDGTSMNDLGTLGGRLSFSWAHGINDSGQVVGSSGFDESTALHAFLYDGTSMSDLGTLGGDVSHAMGINNSGQIVGSSDITGNSARHAFLYDGTSFTDLGTLGGNTSGASDINDSGQIVGSSDITGNSAHHAFLYDGTSMNDLGVLGGNWSSALGINGSGQIVGASQFDENAAAYHAFLYDGGEMLNLNNLIPLNSGWTLEYAIDINSSGQIVGCGDIGGERHAFLMTPLETPVSNAGTNQAALDIDDDGTEEITLDGSVSFDNDGVITSHIWTDDLGDTIADDEVVTATLSVGTHTITLTVTDDDGLTDSDTVIVVVEPYLNDAPVADAGQDITADADEEVTLNASASYDPDWEIVKYTWSVLPEDIILYSGEESIFTTRALGRAEEIFKLTVTDNEGASSEDTVSIFNRRVEEIKLIPGPTGPQGLPGITPAEVAQLQSLIATLQQENTTLQEQIAVLIQLSIQLQREVNENRSLIEELPR